MEIVRTPTIVPSAAIETGGPAQRQVVTDLPEYKTVVQVAGSESARLVFREVPVQQERVPRPSQNPNDDDAQQENAPREINREFEIDRNTSALVFQAIDVSTGDVVRQFPEEARLNLRAYLEETNGDA